MTATLRPMNLGEILDRTFQIYRSRFPVFVGIAALPALVMMCLEMANQFWWKMLPDGDTPTFFLFVNPTHLLYELGLAHGRVLFGVLLWPAFAFATSNAIFGDRASLVGSLKACLARTRSCIGIAAASWSLQFLLPELLIGGSVIGTLYLVYEVFKADPNDPNHMGPLVLVASLLAGWIAFQWIRTMFAMSAPAWAIERLGIRASIRRARELSKGGRLRIFVACLAPATLGWVSTIAISRALPFLRSSCPVQGPFFIYRFRVFAALIPRHGLCISTSAVEAVRILSEAAIMTLIGPIFPIALTLFYYDQRMRREGYDIERLMDAAGLNAPTHDPAPTTAPAENAPSASPESAEALP
jgi:hypothetical protein